MWAETTEDQYVRFYLELHPTEPAKRFKRSSDVAGVLRLSARTVRDLFYAGKIGGFYLGNRLLLIDMESVERYLVHCNQEKM